MSNTPDAKRPAFFDLSQIKQIPITDVCQSFLGIECFQRSGKTWCKTHSERTASTLLHEEENTFYDFGTHRHGDVIELVSYVMDIEKKDAIKMLAEAYGVEALDLRKDRDPNELTYFEYARIGIAGEIATKNFEFNVDRMPYERIIEISQKYSSLDMNELRKKHPKMYEKVLRQKALPFVRNLRNEYFLDLWAQYKLTCDIGNPSLFFRPDSIAFFDNQIKDLQQTERILARAVQGTSIVLRPTREYDPAKDIEMLSKGEIKPVMGTASYPEMQDAAKETNCSVKYRTVDYGKYVEHMMDEGEDLLYSAFLQSGRVVIGYLEADLERFKPFFEKMKPTPAKTEGERSNSYQRTQSAHRNAEKKRQEPER